MTPAATGRRHAYSATLVTGLSRSVVQAFRTQVLEQQLRAVRLNDGCTAAYHLAVDGVGVVLGESLVIVESAAERRPQRIDP